MEDLGNGVDEEEVEEAEGEEEEEEANNWRVSLIEEDRHEEVEEKETRVWS